MPRKPRILSSTGIYHIILRSVNQHIIFEEDSDYLKFLYFSSDCQKKYEVEIYAYCLMDNHVHMLIYSPPEILSTFFNSLETKFVRWYNNKYSRSGHLFQDRFHSTAIENDAAFLSVLTYIHNNPVKAQICPYPSEYRWSSFNAYYGQKNPLVCPSYAYDVAGTKDSLLKYFAEKTNCSEDELFAKDHKPPTRFLTDETALEIFKSVTKLSSISEVSSLTKKVRNEYVRRLKDKGLTIKQIARVLDISVTTVKRLCRLSM